MRSKIMARMNRWVAFLRGMNLGNRRITNEDLCGCFEALGMENATAYQAAGNVVFDSAERSAAKLTKRLEAGLERELAYPVPTFLRSAQEIHAIVACQPFSAEVIRESTGKLQVGLLREAPEDAARRGALSAATEDDRLAIHGRELYWLPARGVGRSELDWKTVDAHLGLMTVRTRGTLERLASKFLP